MKLITYNSTNSIISRARLDISISVNQKGHLLFNKNCIEFIDLKEGDHIEILQNEDEKTDFYIAKTDDENGFKLQCKRSGKYIQMMINSGLAGKLMLSAHDCKRANFKISREPEIVEGRKLYYVISASIYHKR